MQNEQIDLKGSLRQLELALKALKNALKEQNAQNKIKEQKHKHECKNLIDELERLKMQNKNLLSANKEVSKRIIQIMENLRVVLNQ